MHTINQYVLLDYQGAVIGSCSSASNARKVLEQYNIGIPEEFQYYLTELVSLDHIVRYIDLGYKRFTVFLTKTGEVDTVNEKPRCETSSAFHAFAETEDAAIRYAKQQQKIHKLPADRIK